MEGTLPNARERLLTSLRGSSAVIPDIQRVLHQYPFKVHPQVERLEEDVHKELEMTFRDPKDEKRLWKMKSARFSFLCASWWPYSSYECLRVMTHLVLWLFYWDDELDSSEFSSIIYDEASSTKFREETISYIEASLSRQTDCDLAQISTNPLIVNLNQILPAVQRDYSASEQLPSRFFRSTYIITSTNSSSSLNNQLTDQIEALLHELRRYVRMTREEQMSQIENRITSAEGYIRRRMGTSAVCVILALHEYALGIELPRDVMQSSSMQTIWHETNMIVSIMNDMLSLKKEVDLCHVDTLVPILFLEHGSLQTAIDRVISMVQSSMKRLDCAEKELLRCYASSATLTRDLQLFIRNCKHTCTGNLNWTLQSKRYNLNVDSTSGAVHITL
ncbi:isoprenoid synthase domain-containing protein [Xylaria scruposa]|nr:isoprenoid synthase domain-containing protein [Xylaria scruposa]